MKRPRSRCLPWILVPLLAAALTPHHAAAQDFGGTPEADANLGRGFDPTKRYDSSDVDHVNLFNGNLTLGLPLGRSYPLDGGFSVSLGLIYNSSLWDFETWGDDEISWPVGQQPENGCAAYTQAWPSWLFNAGLGWQASLGRLYAPGPPQAVAEQHLAGAPVNQHQPWVYMGPDGSTHELSFELHQPTTTSSVPPGTLPTAPLYSRDGSYLRLRKSSTLPAAQQCGTLVVEMPDGSRSCFAPDPLEPRGHGYAPVRIEDAHGNGVSIAYQNGGLTWVLTDDATPARTYRLVFAAPPAGVFGRALLQRVELPGVAQPFTFDYLYTDVPRTCRDTYPWVTLGDAADPFEQPELPVALLSTVHLPDGSRFDFDYGTSFNCTGGSGLISAMTLPTRGRVEWDYGLWEFPTTQRCPEFNQSVEEYPNCGIDYEPVVTSVGVVERRTIDRDGAALGTWDYLPELPIPPIWSNGSAVRLCERLTERRTVAIDPLGHRTVSYFSVFTQGDDPANDGWRRTEYGLPFTRAERVTSPASPEGTQFLSKETWGCTDPSNRDPTDFSGCTLLSKDYLRYEQDTPPAGCEFQGPSDGFCTKLNSRVVATRTEHFDPDSGAYIAQAGELRSDFDGLGHYRKMRTSGDFCPRNSGKCSGDIRDTFAGFNPGRGTLTVDANGNLGGSFTLPGPSERWLLDTFDQQWVQEGGRKEVREFHFDTQTGFLLRRRVHAKTSTTATIASNRSNRDLVTRFVDDGHGNPAQELAFGGDLRHLSGAGGALPDLSVPESAASYRIDRTWRDGVLVTSFQVDPADTGHKLRLVHRPSIDPATGQVLRSEDAAEVATVFGYDTLARLTSITPDGEAPTHIQYFNATAGAPARVLLGRPDLVGSPGPGDTRSESLYDGFGRVAVSRELTPQGWTRRETTYFGTGAVRTQTTPFFESCTDPAGCPKGTTVYVSYDPYGRPLEVHGPGHDPGAGRNYKTTYRYGGTVGRIVKTFGVALDSGGSPNFGSVSRFEDVDRQGRLWRVGFGAGRPSTTFRHDAGDRLIEVEVSDPAGPKQRRTFGFDGRGLMSREVHPEIAGDVLTDRYDARGNPGRRREGLTGSGYAIDLGMSYDFAGRLVQVTQRPDGPDPEVIEQRLYAAANLGASRSAGKLVASRRLQRLRRSEGSKERRVAVAEGLFYGDAAGRITERTVRAFDGSGDYPALRFTTSFAYDPLGNVETITYPGCEGSGLCPPAEPSFTLDADYTNGRLTRLAETAPTAPWVFASSITYGASGAVRTVTHGNGVVDDWAPDVSGLPRPLRIRATGGGVLWSTGDFVYDGAGSVHKTGTDQYLYDVLGRLTSATVHAPATTSVRHYGYDGFGNLETLDRDGTVLGVPVDAASNRLSSSQGYVYDAAGSLTAASYLNLARVDYDAFRRPLFTSGGGIQRQYLYTPAGERLAVFDNMAETDLWTVRGLGDEVLREYQHDRDAGSWTTRDSIYRGRSLVASFPDDPSEGVRHYHLDHLGSTRLVTSAMGGVLSEHVYAPYGAELTPRGPGETRFRFTGHERDLHNESLAGNTQRDDLDYMHARYYTPELGRFLSVDPVRRDSGSHPQIWNRYAYGRDNPLSFVDPDGRDTYALTANAGGAGGLVGARVEVGLAVDDQGMVALVGTMSNPVVYFGGGASGNLNYTTEDSVEDLRGITFTAELSTPEGGVNVVLAEGEVTRDPETGNVKQTTTWNPNGGGISGGPSVGGGVWRNKTGVLPLFNAGKVAQAVGDAVETAANAVTEPVERGLSFLGEKGREFLERFKNVPLRDADDPDPQNHRN